MKYSIDLYNQVKGKDWPSLDKILDREFDNCAFEIQLEIENFLNTVISDERWKISDKVDSHPTPRQHLDMIDHYFPQIEIGDPTRLWIRDIEEQLLTGKEFHFHPSVPKERL